MVSARLKLVFAVMVAATFVVQGLAGFETLKKKTGMQEVVTEGLERWNQSYRALRESRLRWEKSYRRIDSIPDLVTLIRVLDLEHYGLSADPDKIVLIKQPEDVSQNGVDIGLSRLCVGTGSGNGGDLEVQAPDYPSLLSGLEDLAKRPDIEIGNFTVQGDKAVPVARLGGFCLLVRRA